MKGFKTIAAVVILGSFALTGCTGAKVTKVQADVSALNTRVDNLSADVDAIKSEVAEAHSEATRANQRLDNQVSTYRK